LLDLKKIENYCIATRGKCAKVKQVGAFSLIAQSMMMCVRAHHVYESALFSNKHGYET
jgi:hypothetical protein